MEHSSRTITTAHTHEIEIKKSRFICSLGRATTDDDAKAFIQGIRKQYWDASHNCTAYRLGRQGEVQRTSDDGEPSGTAGIPMLEVLKQRDLTDTVAVVTRYFGGTMLGAGGLIRAYGQADSDAIDAAGIVERRPLSILAVDVQYDDAGRVENALRSSEFALQDVRYGDHVTFEVVLPPEEIEQFQRWLAELTNGLVVAQPNGEQIVEVDV